jgi:hypothetical protein
VDTNLLHIKQSLLDIFNLTWSKSDEKFTLRLQTQRSINDSLYLFLIISYNSNVLISRSLRRYLDDEVNFKIKSIFLEDRELVGKIGCKIKFIGRMSTA